MNADTLTTANQIDARISGLKVHIDHIERETRVVHLPKLTWLGQYTSQPQLCSQADDVIRTIALADLKSQLAVEEAALAAL
jgi:hypothetical protein